MSYEKSVVVDLEVHTNRRVAAVCTDERECFGVVDVVGVVVD